MKTAKKIDPRSMTSKQFIDVMNRVYRKHRFYDGGRRIKYIRPQIDMRDGAVFNIAFDNKTFDFRDDEDGTMYERILAWLSEKEESA